MCLLLAAVAVADQQTEPALLVVAVEPEVIYIFNLTTSRVERTQ